MIGKENIYNIFYTLPIFRSIYIRPYFALIFHICFTLISFQEILPVAKGIQGITFSQQNRGVIRGIR